MSTKEWFIILTYITFDDKCPAVVRILLGFSWTLLNSLLVVIRGVIAVQTWAKGWGGTEGAGVRAVGGSVTGAGCWRGPGDGVSIFH